MKIKDFLTEETWITNHYAVDKDGGSVEPHNPEAVGWCLVGAGHKCYPDAEARWDAMHKLIVAIGDHQIVKFNDNATWPQVRETLEAADI